MKKLLAFLLAALMIFSLTACGGTKELRFVTGGESGTYYAFGTVIAQHATNNIGVKVNALVGAGSKGNVNKLADKEAELAFCQSDVMAYAYDGTNLFEKEGKVTNFSVLGALYIETVQLVAVNPDIKSVTDLKGKNVSVGASGSGVYFNALDVLSAYDMKLEDIKPTYQSFGDSANDLKDGKIDAAFIVAGAPTTAVVDLAATNKNTHLVTFDEAHLNKLLASSPYYTKSVIKGGTYSTVAEDIVTVGVGAVLLVRDDISEDIVYKLTKDIFEDPGKLVSSHAKYGEVTIEYGASMTSVPYHKGAAKFFQEKGVTVKTK
ncbi:MAG: TAXI family TRAP transporter solute-binding subunit [Lachnospiraceae bacterium]|nr:TAXI family TRAP transporter solute-binding subunit [Lachnospiraceae bacterium]